MNKFKCLYCGMEFCDMPQDGVCPNCNGTDIINIETQEKDDPYKDKNVIFHPVENGNQQKNVRLFPITKDFNIMDKDGHFICENGVFTFGSLKSIYFHNENKYLKDIMQTIIIPNPIEAPTDVLYRLEIDGKVWSLGGGGSSIDDFIVTNLDYFYNENTDVAGLNVEYTNFTSKEKKTEQKIIGLADETHSGFMSPSDVAAISKLQQEVKRLEGNFQIIIYSNEADPEEHPAYNPSKEDIEWFATTQEPDKEKWPSIEIVSIEDEIERKQQAWYYITYIKDGEKITEWTIDTIDYTSLFTNKTPGSILGSESKDGKVFAENDGTGSVYGWDRLNEKVNKNTEDITIKQDILLVDNEQDVSSVVLDYSKYLKLVVNTTPIVEFQVLEMENREPEYRALVETKIVPVSLDFPSNFIIKTNDAENIRIVGHIATLTVASKFEINIQNGVVIIYNLDF